MVCRLRCAEHGYVGVTADHLSAIFRHLVIVVDQMIDLGASCFEIGRAVMFFMVATVVRAIWERTVAELIVVVQRSSIHLQLGCYERL
jgi:hypothetical protein